MRPYSLFSALLLTRAHKGHYIGNRVTHIEATDVQKDDSDVRVNSLILLMDQRAVVHLITGRRRRNMGMSRRRACVRQWVS